MMDEEDNNTQFTGDVLSPVNPIYIKTEEVEYNFEDNECDPGETEYYLKPNEYNLVENEGNIKVEPENFEILQNGKITHINSHDNSLGNREFRQIKPNTVECEGCCKQKCSQRFDKDKLSRITSSYKQMKVNEKRRFILKYCSRRNAKIYRKTVLTKGFFERKPNIIYTLPCDDINVIVCSRFFLKTLGLKSDKSDGIIRNAFKISSFDENCNDKRGKYERSKELTEKMKEHILSYNPQQLHCRGEKSCLPSNLTVKSMFHDYKTKGNPGSLETYRKVLKVDLQISFVNKRKQEETEYNLKQDEYKLEANECHIEVKPEDFSDVQNKAATCNLEQSEYDLKDNIDIDEIQIKNVLEHKLRDSVGITYISDLNMRNYSNNEEVGKKGDINLSTPETFEGKETECLNECNIKVKSEANGLFQSKKEPNLKQHTNRVYSQNKNLNFDNISNCDMYINNDSNHDSELKEIGEIDKVTHTTSEFESCCKQMCFQKFEEDKLLSITDSCKRMNIKEKRMFILKYCSKSKTKIYRTVLNKELYKRKPNVIYTLPCGDIAVKVCLALFLKTLGLKCKSDKIIRNAFKLASTPGLNCSDKRGKYERSQELTEKMKEHILSYNPQKSRKLTVKSMFHNYKSGKNPGCLETYRKVLKNDLKITLMNECTKEKTDRHSDQNESELEENECHRDVQLEDNNPIPIKVESDHKDSWVLMNIADTGKNNSSSNNELDKSGDNKSSSSDTSECKTCGIQTEFQNECNLEENVNNIKVEEEDYDLLQIKSEQDLKNHTTPINSENNDSLNFVNISNFDVNRHKDSDDENDLEENGQTETVTFATSEFGTCCRKKCFKKFDKDELSSMTKAYKKMKVKEKRMFILKYCSKTKNKIFRRIVLSKGLYERKPNVEYTLPSQGFCIKVCSRLFLNTLGLKCKSDRVIRNALKLSSTPNSNKRGKYERSHELTDKIKKHILSYSPQESNILGENSCKLTVKSMFADYKSRGNTGSLETYRKVLKNDLKITFINERNKGQAKKRSEQNECKLAENECQEEVVLEDFHSIPIKIESDHKTQDSLVFMNTSDIDIHNYSYNDDLDWRGDIKPSLPDTSEGKTYGKQAECQNECNLEENECNLEEIECNIKVESEDNDLSQFISEPDLKHYTNLLSSENEDCLNYMNISNPDMNIWDDSDHVGDFVENRDIDHVTPNTSECDTCCKQMCFRRFDKEKLSHITDSYKKMKLHEKRMFILKYCSRKNAKNRKTVLSNGSYERKPNIIYTLPSGDTNLKVCSRLFLKTLGLKYTSDKVIRNAFKVSSDLDFKDKRGKYERSNELTEKMKDHILSYNLQKPHNEEKNCPDSKLTVQSMFDNYKSEGNPGSLETYRKVLNNKLKIRFRKDHINLDKFFRCTMCEKTFTTRRCLKKHIDILHLGKLHQCSKCDKMFTERKNLKIHIESVHLGNLLACTECDRKFKSKGGLRKHIISNHSGRYGNEMKLTKI